MKYIKMLGLAAVAAAALMAFVGASSASATVLCKNTSTPCSSKLANGETLSSQLVSGEKAVLKTSFKTIECSESTVAGKVTNEGGSEKTVSGEITTLTFGTCNCTVNVLKKGTLSVTQITGTENGTVTSNGAEVTTVCSSIFGSVHCIYVTNNTDLGTLEASASSTSAAILNVKEAKINVDAEHSNPLCSEESFWTAKYEVTSPKPLYVEPS